MKKRMRYLESACVIYKTHALIKNRMRYLEGA